MSHRPIIDAGPALNFLSIHEERRGMKSSNTTPRNPGAHIDE